MGNPKLSEVITDWLAFTSKLMKPAYYRCEGSFVRIMAEDEVVMFYGGVVDLNKFSPEKKSIHHSKVWPNGFELDLKITLGEEEFQPVYSYGQTKMPGSETVMVTRMIKTYLPVKNWRVKTIRMAYRGDEE